MDEPPPTCAEQSGKVFSTKVRTVCCEGKTFPGDNRQTKISSIPVKLSHRQGKLLQNSFVCKNEESLKGNAIN